jgi:hypothetical protein
MRVTGFVAFSQVKPGEDKDVIFLFWGYDLGARSEAGAGSEDGAGSEGANETNNTPGPAELSPPLVCKMISSPRTVMDAGIDRFLASPSLGIGNLDTEWAPTVTGLPEPIGIPGVSDSCISGRTRITAKVVSRIEFMGRVEHRLEASFLSVHVDDPLVNL